MAARGATTTFDLDVLDELLLLLDDDATPLNVHCELRVEGTIDAERLEAAVREAMLRHPVARASLVPPRLRDRRHRWEIAAAVGSVPLSVVDCAGDDELAGARERLLRHTPPLDGPGPFRALLAHHPDGDALVLNLHHAAGDGAATFRFMSAIARAYADEPDPLPDVDPVAARDVRALIGRSFRDRLRRARGASETVRRVLTGPARMALPDPGPPAGYGFELFTLDRDEVDAVRARGSAGATLNDVLLGGLAVTIRRWNESRGGSSGPVYLMMPVNVRPAEWRSEVFGNFAPWIGVRVAADEQGDLSTAASAAARRSGRIKALGLAGMLVDMWEPAYELPVAVKRLIPPALPLASRFTVETAELSNMGHATGLPEALGEAGAITSFWWTPPGWPKLGASFSAATFRGRLYIGLRYRHAVLNRGGASELAGLYREALVGAGPAAVKPGPRAASVG
jgi:NRPS condensation-like uncharacterized protein